MYGEQTFVSVGAIGARADAVENLEVGVDRRGVGAERGEGLGARKVVEWQASLFASGDTIFDEAFAGLERRWLDATSWIDHQPRWLDGSDHLFAELVARLPWRQRTVPMYDHMVQEPRLTWWSGDSGELPLRVLDDMRGAVSQRYERRFDSCGCNYYRTGADSVAWHGDRVRFAQEDPIVAIVSVGAPRQFLLRPRGGGRSLSFLLGHGDLLVMGGAVQHDWEHTVPKVARVGPRISITYRHGAEPPTDTAATARAHHPSAGAHNRHEAATPLPHTAGTLEARRADIRGARSATAGPETGGLRSWTPC